MVVTELLKNKKKRKDEVLFHFHCSSKLNKLIQSPIHFINNSIKHNSRKSGTHFHRVTQPTLKNMDRIFDVLIVVLFPRSRRLQTEDVDSSILRNVVNYLPGCTALRSPQDVRLLKYTWTAETAYTSTVIARKCINFSLVISSNGHVTTLQASQL